MVDNKKLGDIGEDIVAKYCEDLGFLVEKSESEYDQVKDMTIDGRTPVSYTHLTLPTNREV